jgi:hypothetical protein
MDPRYFAYWRKTFLEKNHLTEEVFDRHVRIQRHGVVPQKEFEVEYSLTVDWLQTDWRDHFPVWSDAEGYLEESAIEEATERRLGRTALEVDIPEHLRFATKQSALAAARKRLGGVVKASYVLLGFVPSSNVTGGLVCSTTCAPTHFAMQVETPCPSSADPLVTEHPPPGLCRHAMVDLVTGEIAVYEYSFDGGR